MTPSDLKNLRIDLRMTQEVFAERLGISRTYLAALEKGRQTVSEGLLLKIEKLFRPAPAQEGRYLIPYYDIDATASPMEIFEENTNLPSTNMDLPGFAGCDFAINVAGHSMYPSIEAGSMILCKKITDKTIIMYGEVYFIVTKDYRMVRRLQRSQKKGWVNCVADNHNGHNSKNGLTYDNIELPMEKILHLYIVQGSIKRHQI
jgi:transcriptional regulator with XRE-family HTH domain